MESPGKVLPTPTILNCHTFRASVTELSLTSQSLLVSTVIELPILYVDGHLPYRQNCRQLAKSQTRGGSDSHSVNCQNTVKTGESHFTTEVADSPRGVGGSIVGTCNVDTMACVGHDTDSNREHVHYENNRVLPAVKNAEDAMAEEAVVRHELGCHKSSVGRVFR